jgi:formaldehyde-activating enzyme involved in methanogenesis
MASKPKVAETPKPKIVEAAGLATSSGGKRNLGAEIEKAMATASLVALEQGITDPDKVRELKLAAREEVKAKASKEDADEAAKAKGAGEAVKK